MSSIIRSMIGIHSRPCYVCGAPQTPMTDKHTGEAVLITAHEFICLKNIPPILIPPFLRVEFNKTIDWERQERRKRLSVV